MLKNTILCLILFACFASCEKEKTCTCVRSVFDVNTGALISQTSMAVSTDIDSPCSVNNYVRSNGRDIQECE